MKQKICYFKIKPSDTMFFRSGSIFKKRFGNYIESLDIPYPSVFYGAIFSMLLRQKKFKYILEYIKNKSGNIPEELEKVFKIDGIYLYDEVKKRMFIKAPLDLFENKFGTALGIYKDNHFYSPISDISKYERADGKFIGLDDLINSYYKGFINKIQLYSRDYFFTTYIKTGIEMDRGIGSAKNNFMYRVNMVEFADKRFSYIVKCRIDPENIPFENDILKLGGESKIASVVFTDKSINVLDDLENYFNRITIFNNKIKVILTSLMIIDGQDNKEKKDNILIRITGRPDYIGGFDMASGEQKTINKAIPAGSVLILENDCFKGKKIGEIYNKFILDVKEKFKGFGNVIIMPFERGNKL
ncbi:type III-B CRISPR module-associated Cmr3 family protein [Clostridium sp. MT-14]|uniref:type III-B CRISPR module-associated Cmr3 family protein n=1 Tax=Clostridium sp. MT-14 TaxID=3348360 RepID=UPI0035F48155